MSHRSCSPVKSPEGTGTFTYRYTHMCSFHICIMFVFYGLVKKEEVEEDTLNPVIRKDSLKVRKH